VELTSDLTRPVEGKDVIVVEDIVDTGQTMHWLLGMLQARRPASLAVCALLVKPARALVEVPVRYRGFDIADEFVVGYGLDHDGRMRNLPYVGVMKG
jgi:hypoxanthine phosphoribosyltransferase